MNLLRLSFLALAAWVVAPAAEPIRYTVRFPEPQTHYLEVEASVPTAGRPRIELMMAVWTPGSYLVREYARHLESFSAQTPDGKPLPFVKTRKNRWRIDTGGAASVHVSYRVYAHEMSVQGNWVEGGFAVLSGAANFLALAGEKQSPYDVRFVLPAAWKTSMTGLPAAPGGEAHHYLAPDFDTLVDCPILAGNPAVYEFEVAGKKHYLVNEGEGGVWDGPASAAQVARIVQEYHRMWGFLPYDKYLFLNVLSESGGGLEHLNSTLMMASRWAWRNTTEPAADAVSRPPTRSRWLGLVSHEYFHAWNVKRLRPVELGPFDYENEVYTRNLWIAEGFTSYYGELALRRAGLLTRDAYLRSLSRLIDTLQTTNGRLVQPVADSSFDTWIKFYRPDENSANTGISYYTKGAVIGWLLDAKIRKATGGARTLDDVMKLACQRYAGPRGYTTAEFFGVVREVGGAGAESWLRRAAESTEELDYGEALDWFGLRFRTEERPAPPFLGIETRIDGGRLLVTTVRRGTPAYQAGLNADDEILALNEYRVRPEQLLQRLAAYQPGDRVSLLVARRDHLERVELTLAAPPPGRRQLEAVPQATPAQADALRAWLRE